MAKAGGFVDALVNQQIDVVEQELSPLAPRYGARRPAGRTRAGSCSGSTTVPAPAEPFRSDYRRFNG